MADTTNLKTFDLICPDPNCAESFQYVLDPAVLTDEGELIECPACLTEWEWEYEADKLTLLADAEDEEDDEHAEDKDDEEEDDEEEDDEEEDEDEPA